MFDPATIDSARLRRFYDYWDLKRRGRRMPSHADMDPTEFAWAIGDVSLVEPLPDGDFLWRLDGGNLEEFFRCSMKGKRLGAYPYSEYVEKMRNHLLIPVQTGEPVYLPQHWVDRSRHWNYTKMLLPVSSDDRKVDLIYQMLQIGTAK